MSRSKRIMHAVVTVKLFSTLNVDLTDETMKIARLDLDDVLDAIAAGYVYYYEHTYNLTTAGDQAYREAKDRPIWLEDGWLDWIEEVLTGIDKDGNRTTIENPALPTKKKQQAPRTRDPLQSGGKESSERKRLKRYKK